MTSPANAPFRLGLTGSIGMGKSTTAACFASHGLPVWNADAAVHRLYAKDGAATAGIAALHPSALRDGAIDRGALRAWIAADPGALTRIESLVHPLTAQDRAAFIAAASGADIVVLEVPLLFESGADTDMDATLLVTAPPGLQRARVMARPGMTAALFETLLARQMPDAEKRSRASHILESLSLDLAQTYVGALLAHLRQHRDA